MTSYEEMPAGKAPDTSTGYDGAKASHKLPIRTLVAASVGNAVEWYDWTIYATFSIYFATQIFSAETSRWPLSSRYYLRPRLLLPPARWLFAGPLRRR